jgi:ATP-dependent 26S proteasome regulatory subunit
MDDGSPDESWQDTPRRSTRKLLESSRKLYEKEQAETSRKRKLRFDTSNRKDDGDGHGRRRSGRKRSVLFDSLNVSLIGEQVLSSSVERQYHLKGIREDMGMESDIEPYESILTLNNRKGSKRPRLIPTRSQQTTDQNSDNEQETNQEDEDESEADSSENSKESSDEDTANEDEDATTKSYYLRQHKPAVQRFTIPIEKNRSNINLFNSPARRKHTRHHRTPLHCRRRHQARHMISSTSSSDSNEEDERKFQRRKEKSMNRSRSQLMPMNMARSDMKRGILLNRQKVGSSLADIEPMNIDRNINFSHVGGLSKLVEALKEMLVFPLLYPEVYDKFQITPPRGVLFHGAPGTGKTLVARALANECGKSGQKVAFFMRKGADCLSKWVGESERQLRLLFDQVSD